MKYKADRETALSKGYSFFVAEKLERDARWLHLREDITDLHEALVQAQSHAAYEVAVFVVRDGLGYIYWTSRVPDLYNTTVIRILDIAFHPG